MKIQVAIETRNGGRAEDRAAYFTADDRHILVLADGAGGTGSGAEAAELVVDQAKHLLDQPDLPLESALYLADAKLAQLGGLSTGIIVEIQQGFIYGVSCGDSVCWLIAQDDVIELTHRQHRKPLIGDGCEPVLFDAMPIQGRLLLASDGLVKYANMNAIVSAARHANLQIAASKLAELPQLRDGSFPDDVAVILVEVES